MSIHDASGLPKPPKSRTVKFLNTVIVILAVVLAGSCLLHLLAVTTPSNAYKEPREGELVKMQDIYTGKKVILPFSAKYNELQNRAWFYSTQSLAQLKESVENQGEAYRAQEYGSFLLITHKRENGTQFACVLQQSNPAYAQERITYELYTPVFPLTDPSNVQKEQSVVFPVHLLANDVLEKSNSEMDDRYKAFLPISGDVYYKTPHSREVFTEFYRMLGLYTMEETPDGFLLRGYAAAEKKYPEFAKPIRFQFREIEGELFVRVFLAG